MTGSAKPAFFLGLDIQPDGIDIVVLDQSGACQASFQRAFAHSDGDATLDPQEIWRAARTGIKELLRRSQISTAQIRCLGLTGCEDGPVMLDPAGNILCPTLLGSHADLEPFRRQVVERVGDRNFANLTGSPSELAWLPAKLLWIRQRFPRVWHDLASFLQPRDFLRFRLTGTRITDPSTASASHLYSPRTQSWSRQMLTRLELDTAWMPSVQSGHLLSGRVTQTASRESSIQAGTPVITGGSQMDCLALATGYPQPGRTVIALGGRGGLIHVTEVCRRDPACSSNSHCLEGLWTIERPGIASGLGLEWLMANVVNQEVQVARRNHRSPLDLLAEMAAETPPGADDVFLLPLEDREGGGFLGLKSHHQRSHLVRATLESTAFRIATILARIAPPASPVALTGPGAANTLWCQIICDAIGAEIEAFPEPHGPARGAAMLAASAIGIFPDLPAACAQMLPKPTLFRPRPAAVARYRESILRFQHLVAWSDPHPAPAPAPAEEADA